MYHHTWKTTVTALVAYMGHRLQGSCTIALHHNCALLAVSMNAALRSKALWLNVAAHVSLPGSASSQPVVLTIRSLPGAGGKTTKFRSRNHEHGMAKGISGLQDCKIYSRGFPNVLLCALVESSCRCAARCGTWQATALHEVTGATVKTRRPTELVLELMLVLQTGPVWPSSKFQPKSSRLLPRRQSMASAS